MKMNRILLFAIIVSGCAPFSQAQTSDDVGKIALSVQMPRKMEDLNGSQLSKLESKITQIAIKAGLATLSYDQSFVIYPKFEVYDNGIVEGGMQNLTVVTAELSLYMKQASNDILFASVSKNVKGSGKNKELAITSAISQIPVSDKEFTAFIETGKQKILQYYATHCDDIIKKADSYSKMQQYEQAIVLLMSIPEEATACYDKAIEKSLKIFKAYQNQVCAEKIRQAKAKSAAQDYEGALEILLEIDPSAKCFNESLSLIKSIEPKVDAEIKRDWDFQMKQYNDAIHLEKRRIDALKEMVVAYYKSRKVDQTIIVK
ncbi:hypothetical protein FACS1894182_01610 [Bacteroidia bacterium]|nr:hypothetical protein FACS1894182_01610 [Bacteroidia bacterium]